MVLRIHKENCQTGLLNQHFAEAYPNDEILDINVAYDVSKLTQIDNDRQRARIARIHCEE
jgi:hypothetical protein